MSRTQRLLVFCCLLVTASVAATAADLRHAGWLPPSKRVDQQQVPTDQYNTAAASLSSHEPLGMRPQQAKALSVAAAVPTAHSHGSSALRRLQQAQPLFVNNRELPRLVIGQVKAVVVNTYSWSIQRQSTASGIAVLADGYSRKQLGYTLTFTRTLQKTQYRLEGLAAITNPSAQGTATLQSIHIVAGGTDTEVPCAGMPSSTYELQPAAVLECPFAITWDGPGGASSSSSGGSNGGSNGSSSGSSGLVAADSVSGYLQTSFGRAAAATPPVAYSVEGCRSGGSSGSSSSGAACSVVERAGCVSVTDGSYIMNKYKDRLGQQLSGNVTRSRLFATSDIQASTLGPPRIEPVTPGAVAVASVQARSSPEWTPSMPDSSWWNSGSSRRAVLAWRSSGSSRHKRALLSWGGLSTSSSMPDSSWWNSGSSSRHRRVLLRGLSSTWVAGQGEDEGSSSMRSRVLRSSNSGSASRSSFSSNQESGNSSSSSSSRQLLGANQAPPSKQGELAATLDANFRWPYPTITGERPPLGLNGKPERGSSKQVCDSKTFSFGMVFGPLLPAACGTFEVQNFAAALPTDGSGPAVTLSTYTYLQVLCPAATQETATQQQRQQQQQQEMQEKSGKGQEKGGKGQEGGGKQQQQSQEKGGKGQEKGGMGQEQGGKQQQQQQKHQQHNNKQQQDAKLSPPPPPPPQQQQQQKGGG